MTTISGAELLRVIHAAGIYTLNGCVMDERYVLPTAEQVNGEFADEFRARLPEMGLQVYEPEKGDCDDYSPEAWNLMRRFWRKTKGSIAAGIAFGVINFLRRDNIAHEINFYVTRINGRLALCPWEPQTQSDSILIPTEIQSCDFFIV